MMAVDVISRLRVHVEQLDSMAPSMEELIAEVEVRQLRRPLRRVSWWNRRRGWAVTAAAGVFVVLAAISMVILQGGDVALATLALPDGTEIVIDEFFAAGDDEALDDLERRLAEFGVVLEVVTRPVNPKADGLVYSVTWAPPLDIDESGRVVIPLDAFGAQIRIEVGVGDTTAGNAGLFLFEAYPEICMAVHPRDTAATNTALANLGIRVDWDLVTGDPDGEGGGLAFTRLTDPPPGVIISVLTADGQAEAPPSRPDRLAIEVIPEDAVWHQPVSTDRCTGGQ